MNNYFLFSCIKVFIFIFKFLSLGKILQSDPNSDQQHRQIGKRRQKLNEESNHRKALFQVLNRIQNNMLPGTYMMKNMNY